MATYGDMKNRIADELGGRSDLLANSSGMSSSPIELAILDAVSFWQDNRFFFDEYRTAAAFYTVAGQEFYTSSDWADIATMPHIDKLSVLISGNRYFMEPRTEQYIEDISMSPTNYGQPVDYAYYNFQLRFYPIPDAAYAVNALGTKAFTALSSASDTNVWTTTAEALIRTDAKMRLFRHTLMDPINAAEMEREAQREFGRLKASSHRRVPVQRFKPTQF